MCNSRVCKGFVLVCALTLLIAGVFLVARFQRTSVSAEIDMAGGIEVSPAYAIVQNGGAGAGQVDFQIRNVSSADATIHQVSSSCSCVAMKELAGTVLSPGDSVLLPVVSNVPQFGKRFTVVSVVTSVGTVQIPITMQGRDEPLPSVISFPERVEVSVGHGADSGDGVVHLISKEGCRQPYWVKAISTSVSSCTARISSVEELQISSDVCQRTYSIVVSAGPPGPHSEYQAAWLTPVFAFGEGQSNSRCLVVSRRDRLIRLSPAAVVFRGGGLEFSRSVEVISDHPNALLIWPAPQFLIHVL